MNKNFTQFDLRTPLLTSDYVVGYKSDGSSELRTTIREIVDLAENSTLSEIINYLATNRVSVSSLSARDSISVPDLTIEKSLTFSNANTQPGQILISSISSLNIVVNGQLCRIPLMSIANPAPIEPVPPSTPLATNVLYAASFIPLKVFIVTNSGNSSYTIDQVGSNNPTLTCYRGTNYDFIAHNIANEPFCLRTELNNTITPVSGTYNNNALNGITIGRIMFTPNEGTPNVIYYQSTNTSSISGRIIIADY